MIMIFLLILPVIFCAEKCEDLVIDLNNGSYYRENIVFDLNQTCQYTFIIPDEALAYVDIYSDNIFDSWYEFESSAGEKFLPAGYYQRDRYNFPPPYLYLHFFLVGDNQGYNPQFNWIIVEAAPLPFSTATVFDLRMETTVVPIVRYQGANVLKFIGEEGAVLHVIPPLYDHIDQWERIFVMNGTEPGGQPLGNASAFIGSTVFSHNITVFYDDLNFGALTAGSTCVLAVFDRKDYSKYEQFYVEPASTKTFPLNARNKPCGVMFSSQSASTYSVEVTSFFLLPFDIPENGVLYIYGGLPFRNNSNLLHTITTEYANLFEITQYSRTMGRFTFPMVFNGYIYSFVLYNASVSLSFSTAYNVDEFPFTEMNLTVTDGNYSMLTSNDKTGYIFTSEDEHLYYMSISGVGTHFSLQVDPSVFGFDGRDGIINYTVTDLEIVGVTPSAIFTITSGATDTSPIIFVSLLLVIING